MQAQIHTCTGADAGFRLRRFVARGLRRRQAGRAGSFSPVCPATFSGRTILRAYMVAGCLIPSIALASDGPVAADVAAELLGSWLVQLGIVMGLLVAALKIYDHFRPKPALHQQFAPMKHVHADLVDASAAKDCREKQAREIMAMRQEMGGFTSKVERQIDHLRNALSTQAEQVLSAIAALDEKQEGRIRRIHDRIDPIVERVAANKQAIEQHLADQRSKGN